MENEIISAKTILYNTNVSILDAARLVKNILDSFEPNSNLSPIQFCSKVIETGKQHIRTKEMSLIEGFTLYLQTKHHLRKDSFNDIKYLGNRLLKSNPNFACRNFSDLKLADCQTWLESEFMSANEISATLKDPKGETAHAVSASQFNKARTMLHGLFEFALRKEWCDKNPIKLIQKKKVIEKEILPLSISETKKLIKTTKTIKNSKYKNCLSAVALLIFAGIRPREVRRLNWNDIDFEESTITIRSQCSKTGGVRQVEICPILKNLLCEQLNTTKEPNIKEICPQNWLNKWKRIRDAAGFKGKWVQDVLRHTFASYHAKNYKDLPRLQLNMGHRDQSILRSRYINMSGISAVDAKRFFN